MTESIEVIRMTKPRKHDNRNPYHTGAQLSVPWGLSRVVRHDEDLPRTIAATSINHQPGTRPYSTVFQVIETDDKGMPIRWVVRNAHWEHMAPDPSGEQEECMRPDGYGNGTYYWHGQPAPSEPDRHTWLRYIAAWEAAVDKFAELAKHASRYEMQMVMVGRIDGTTGRRKED